jgi:hypothetical protein
LGSLSAPGHILSIDSGVISITMSE